MQSKRIDPKFRMRRGSGSSGAPRGGDDESLAIRFHYLVKFAVSPNVGHPDVCVYQGGREPRQKKIHRNCLQKIKDRKYMKEDEPEDKIN